MPGGGVEWQTRLNAPTARVHDEHNDSMNTKNTPPGTHRELRVIVGIVWQRRS